MSNKCKSDTVVLHSRTSSKRRNKNNSQARTNTRYGHLSLLKKQNANLIAQDHLIPYFWKLSYILLNFFKIQK